MWIRVASVGIVATGVSQGAEACVKLLDFVAPCDNSGARVGVLAVRNRGRRRESANLWMCARGGHFGG